MSGLMELNALSSDILSRVIKLSISPLILTDYRQKDNPIIYANQAFLELTGYNESEVIGLNCRFLQGEGTNPEAIAKLRSAVKHQKPLRIVLENYRKDGSPFWNDLSISPITNAEGDVTYFLGMQLDITEHEQVKEQIQTTIEEASVVQEQADALKRQQKHLLELNKAKDEFISLSSHQLRTPATSVKQYLGMLLEGYAGEIPENIRVFLRTAYDSNERQLTIINDLLRTAQLDSGRYTLHKQKYDVHQLIQEVINEHMSVIIMRQQYITLEGGNDCTVNVDSTDIKLALMNLIENASKYSPEHSTITIKVAKQTKHVRITVQDNGVGLQKSDISKIFDRFTRVDNELSDTVSGSGLGLYFVKRITKLHGGRVEVKSVPGEGSSFTMVLPL